MATTSPAPAEPAADDGRPRKRNKRDKSYGSYLPLGSALRTYCATVSYDGSGFIGFQLQDLQDANKSNGAAAARTVQRVLEDALKRTTGETIRLRFASRTDKGVHAVGQVIAFASAVAIDDDSNDDTSVFLRAINNRLPDDVVITAMTRRVPADFEPRRQNKAKCYIYRLRHGATRLPLQRHQVWQMAKPLNVDAMVEAAGFLQSDEAQDFRMFTPSKALDEATSTWCTVTKVHLHTDADQILHVQVVGNRFLYKMVRTIVGVLVDVGLGKLTPQQVRDMVTHPTDRTLVAGAPPHGLVLQWIQLKECFEQS
ncbi:tRNA pseudouridine(38-40) synthase [Aphanomyces invadans]|uniref:tRNA pseudouridine synthase n=1 Tax=Aphanomyces invadans TaxID=157072 RepID=A0A024TGB7_9STRA|nr:tRNA pseudouridine(38-40) synthase [Aphanomyces invadans]ETV92372.1 tRNA pseudouridine(38-40) synthase [Aphanomyces invadans]|eukprot:XP_008878923.1 tRNA pseudouridine(38-40) synthase [Aphanomyces invadans]